MQTKFDRLRIAAALAAAILSAPPGTAQTPSLTTLYSFQGGSDGVGPYGGVALVNGSLYGTTDHGGAGAYCAKQEGCGTVFQLVPPSSEGGAWTESVIHTFVDTASDGYFPGAGVTPGGGGILYGTTASTEDPNGGGTVFELAPPTSTGGTWTETVLWNFLSQERAPRNPSAPVIIGPAGQLFGTTIGGPNCVVDDCGGTVFELVPPSAQGGSWSERTLDALVGDTSQNCSYGPVVAGTPGGTLYAAVYAGGNADGEQCVFGCGWVLQLAPPAVPGGAWASAQTYAFGGPPTDGASPYAGLTVGSGGTLYGVTEFGGAGSCETLDYVGGCGVVFELTPPATSGAAWTEAVLYSFTGKNGDGAYPIGGLLLGTNGLLYGTTYGGGNLADCPPFTAHAVAGCGTIFQLTPPASPGGAWTETILHAFNNTDGALPRATLTPGKGSVLYGTTYGGGAHGYGTVFQLKP
ncbi:MAG TPA: choice-of-anchor tandem repeat GloVer-containing protein [Bryobacteraceae bacterium]|nr:choice-of-anchor tandem repeat GloVer-containing protein [Bryobacteraceae bacterium]